MSLPRAPLAALHAEIVAETTGVLRLRGEEPAPAPWRVRLELVRGWVHAVLVEHDGPDGEEDPPAPSLAADLLVADDSTRLARLLAILIRRSLRVQILDEPRRRAGTVAPFHPLPALRAAIEALAADRVEAGEQLVAARVADRPLSLRAALHGSAVDPDESAAVRMLSTPRSFGELAARARRPRLLRLLRDAALLGALDGADPLGDELHALLVEPADARRRAYHEQARQVHPDLHPDDDEEARRERTAKMAELAARDRREK